MLPMFRAAEDVARFVDLVGGRAGVVGLLETREAADDVDAVARVPGLDELHVGINDLALALGLRNRFAVLVSPAAERIARAAAAAGLRLGSAASGAWPTPGCRSRRTWSTRSTRGSARRPRSSRAASSPAGATSTAEVLAALAGAARVVGEPPARGARRRGVAARGRRHARARSF